MSLPAKLIHLEPPRPAEDLADHRVVAVLNCLSMENLARVPSIKPIAIALGISPGRLRHIFKQHTGLSFTQYTKRLRLHRARQLFQETRLSGKQVMLEVGISDHSHFAKAYKKEFGETPSQTRRCGSSAKTKLTFAQVAS